MSIQLIKKLFVGLIIFGFIFIACDDENDKPPITNGNDEEPIPLVFDSLSADKDTIIVGDVVTVTAIASGKELNYDWSVSSGGIEGGGNEIVITSNPCLEDDIDVTCKITDYYDEYEEKTITIYVTF